MINDMIIWWFTANCQGNAKCWQHLTRHQMVRILHGRWNIWSNYISSAVCWLSAHEIVIVLCTRRDLRPAGANLKYKKAFLLFAENLVNQTPGHGIRVSNDLIVLIANHILHCGDNLAGQIWDGEPEFAWDQPWTSPPVFLLHWTIRLANVQKGKKHWQHFLFHVLSQKGDGGQDL